MYQTLQERLTATTEEYTKQLNSHQTHIANLEKKRQEQDLELKSLQERFTITEKERHSLAETLQERETVLHKQLETKEREWVTANEVLREQLSALTTESLRKSEGHLGRIADLDKTLRRTSLAV